MQFIEGVCGGVNKDWSACPSFERQSGFHAIATYMALHADFTHPSSLTPGFLVLVPCLQSPKAGPAADFKKGALENSKRYDPACTVDSRLQ